MKIGLDFDGVFCDVSKLLNQGAFKIFGLEFNLLNNNQTEILKEFVFEDINNGLELEPVSDVVSACRHLISNGHKLEIITKRNEGVKIARNFCRNIGLDIKIIGLKSNQPKSSVAHGLDIFLDDSINNICDLQTVVPQCYLFSDDCDEDTFKVQRVSSWHQFIQKIIN